jgi:hypothetical protein
MSVPPSFTMTIAMLAAIVPLLSTVASAPAAKACSDPSDCNSTANYAVPGYKIGLTCVPCNHNKCNCFPGE